MPPSYQEAIMQEKVQNIDSLSFSQHYTNEDDRPPPYNPDSRP
jgi:hypothetical protein